MPDVILFCGGEICKKLRFSGVRVYSFSVLWLIETAGFDPHKMSEAVELLIII